MLVYFVFSMSIILGIIAQKRNNYFFTFLLILVLSLFVGLRSVNVGIDTYAYNNFLILLERNQFSPNVERGFLYICLFFLKLFGSKTAVFFCFSLLTNFCFLTRVWMFRKKSPFIFSLIIYLCMYYPETCNIMRQSFSISVIFLATVLLERKRYTSYIVICCLMFFVHNVSILGVLLLPLYILYTNGIPHKTKTKLILLSCLVLPVGIFVLSVLLNKYLNTYSVANSGLGLMNFIRIFLFIISFYLRSDLFKKNESAEIANNNRFILISYLLGIIISFSGYYITTFTRIALNFIIFEVIFIPLVCCYKKKYRVNGILFFAYAFVIGYFFITNSISGWSGLGKYSLALWT